MTCPLCGGQFAILEAWRDTRVACPHCQMAVTVPLLTTTSGASAAEPSVVTPEKVDPAAVVHPEPESKQAPQQEQSPEPESEPEPPKVSKPLTANEREARRRRVNLMIAIVCGFTLIVATLVLSTLGT